jgi:two-component sensor histidine kinase
MCRTVTGAVFCLFLIAFSTPVSGQTDADSLWSFPEIRSDSTGQGTPDYLGKPVKVAGIVNTESGLLHEHYLQIFIQNDSTGLSVFAPQIDEPVQAGDSIVVNGSIEVWLGMTEVHADNYRVYKEVRQPPVHPLADAISRPASYRGMLAEGEGVITEKGSTFNGKYFRISPENNADSMMVYVSNFHTLFSDFNFRVLSVGDRVGVRGVINEFQPENTTTGEFKLFLRSPDDLRHIGLPAFYLRLILGGILAVALIILGWILYVRHRVKKETRAIRMSLNQKEVLLKEIHHRVKNSLSIVSGLIELQAAATDDQKTKHILQDSRTRIKSVGLIHEKLYQTDSLSDIEMDIYIRELVEAILETFTEYKDAVTLEFDLDKIVLDHKRGIHCGLLINELVVNAFKHAFTKKPGGILSIALKDEGPQIILSVSDNGPGIPDDFDPSRENSLGSMLIDSFAMQLDAKTEIREARDGGTEFLFRIPSKKKQKRVS